MIPRIRTLVTAAVLAAALLIVGVLAAPPAPPLQAQSTGTEMHRGSDLIPSGLEVGDRFRLLIVTSTTRTAQSTAIADYDTHVRNAVASANGHPDIRSYSSGFRVLGSTETVNARDHTETRATDTSAPIYYLNGEGVTDDDKVSDDYAGLYDGGWDSDVPFDENGDEIGMYDVDYPTASTPQVWTGTNSDGTTGNFGANDAYLGVVLSGTNSVAFGVTRLPGREVRNSLPAGSGQTKSLYGLSQVFVVPAPPSTDATLSDLELQNASNGSDIALTPGFTSGHLAYSASVGFPVSRVTVIPTRNDAGASIRYLNASNEKLGDGDRFQFPLTEGAQRVIRVEVTAEDRIAKETYTLTVARAARPGKVFVSERLLSLTEGDSGSYSVRLDRQPAADVRVFVFNESGSADTTVTLSTDDLTFTPSNWNQRQWVFVSTGSDTNTTNESVTLVP